MRGPVLGSSSATLPPPPTLPQVGNKFQILATVDPDSQGVQPILAKSALQSPVPPGQPSDPKMGQPATSEAGQTAPADLEVPDPDLGTPSLHLHEQVVLTDKAQRATRVSVSPLAPKQHHIAASIIAKQGQPRVAPSTKHSASVPIPSVSKVKQGHSIKEGTSATNRGKPAVQVMPTNLAPSLSQGTTSSVKAKGQKHGAQHSVSNALGHFLADMGADSPIQSK